MTIRKNIEEYVGKEVTLIVEIDECIISYVSGKLIYSGYFSVYYVDIVDCRNNRIAMCELDLDNRSHVIQCVQTKRNVIVLSVKTKNSGF